ncbi:MAG: hypothetical protein FWG92_04835 [Leptospirales bacterium]|nr:hypothetical protein [Leptospirales bacterium]
MKKVYFLGFLLSVLFLSQALFADSYEDYRQYRDSSNAEYKAVAKTNEPWGIYDGLRDTIRDEVHRGLVSVETNSDLDNVIRKIVREEIKEALQREKRKYATEGVFEIGGHFSVLLDAPSSISNGGKAHTIFASGVMNYFLLNNLAFSLKGGGEFDISNNHQFHHIGMGPLLACGIDRSNQVSFYCAVYIGTIVNSFIEDKYGMRYTSEIGLKFGFGKAILNVGLSATFENSNVSDITFNKFINPMIGITVWL